MTQPVVWSSVPATIEGWLGFAAEYDRLYKLAESLPGLEETAHVVHCRPYAGLLRVAADVPGDRAETWAGHVKRAGVALRLCRVDEAWPGDYGRVPWMLVARSFDPGRPFRKQAGAFPSGRFFESPSALAAALAGAILQTGTGGLVKDSQYSKTPLRDARLAAAAVLGGRPSAVLEKAARARRGSDPVPVRPGEFTPLVWADPLLSPAVKAAADGLVSAAAVDGRAWPGDFARVAVGLGVPHDTGLRAGKVLSALVSVGAEKQAVLQRSGHWGAAVARVVLPVFGRPPGD